MNLGLILNVLQRQRSARAAEISRLDQAIATLQKLDGGKPAASLKKRKMSKTAKAKIAAAQRARWAKWHAKHKK